MTEPNLSTRVAVLEEQRRNDRKDIDKIEDLIEDRRKERTTTYLALAGLLLTALGLVIALITLTGGSHP